MRRRFALPLLFAAIGASGCSAGLRGVWAGSCIVIGDRDPFEVPLEVELVYDRQGILIAIGGALLEAFWWMPFVFGVFLIITGIRMARHTDTT